MIFNFRNYHLGGYIVLSVTNAAMWMDDSMRWGGRDDS